MSSVQFCLQLKFYYYTRPGQIWSFSNVWFISSFIIYVFYTRVTSIRYNKIHTHMKFIIIFSYFFFVNVQKSYSLLNSYNSTLFFFFFSSFFSFFLIVSTLSYKKHRMMTKTTEWKKDSITTIVTSKNVLKRIKKKLLKIVLFAKSTFLCFYTTSLSSLFVKFYLRSWRLIKRNSVNFFNNGQF